MVWDHKGKGAGLVWFTTRQEQIAQSLHAALLESRIWSYDVTLLENSVHYKL